MNSLKFIFIILFFINTIYHLYLYSKKKKDISVKIEKIKEIQKIAKIEKDKLEYHRKNTKKCDYPDIQIYDDCNNPNPNIILDCYVKSNYNCVWDVVSKRCNKISPPNKQ